jgi:hypothetical protein
MFPSTPGSSISAAKLGLVPFGAPPLIVRVRALFMTNIRLKLFGPWLCHQHGPN